ncbi:F-box only protein 41 isoform X3 [Silurus meridionalis]|uniref:F-box only protein 41 isoform X3 n=1 Tax=Silurus meridionalis TaxID=175797 RepID=UPI001EEAD893|nr:F-box only protein 41 isoform X3 [Silurus meridionalis]XP_046724875.1 F-box only protein 41 isoform X3 [Silurus meridionalis]
MAGQVSHGSWAPAADPGGSGACIHTAGVLAGRGEEEEHRGAQGSKGKRENGEGKAKRRGEGSRAGAPGGGFCGDASQPEERADGERRGAQPQTARVCDLDRFVQETALKEASAKLRLQSFIENLLERAERAERQLQELHTPSRITSPDGSFTVAGGALHQRCYSESAISRCCYSQCDHTGSPVHRSEVCEVLCEVQCYQKNPSDMEADSDSWSVYSTESLEGLKQHYRIYNKRENPAFRHHSRHRGNRPDRSAMCLKQVKRRAWLFCVFPYLDTHSLLTAAQVCKDWWSVAHHPAMWSRVTLENNRISSKFMVTMAQWCSETHTLVLHNLKPRTRAKKESKEEYLKNTRGCLEAGLEAVLRAAGRSLVALTVSHCTNILTDRTLWLVSCHCRALQTLTYRSSSDPVGQEVIWALGAGCRDITSLKIAPLQPCEELPWCVCAGVGPHE